MRNRGFLFAFYGSFKHTVVLKKTLDVFEKTLDVFKNSSDVFEKTTVCFFFNVHIHSEKSGICMINRALLSNRWIV